MKKWIVCLMVVLLCFAPFCMASSKNTSSPGPALNAGDGIPDGSGDAPGNEPNTDSNADTGNGDSGPAPNAGDGVSDGSGLESPNGPHGN